MVKSNVSIPGKILLILLTVVITLGALVGGGFLVYKKVKVRSIAGLFSSDLISESYDGTLEDLVQLLAQKAMSGEISLQDLIDISPALGAKLDSIISNIENVGLFKVDKDVLYTTPVAQISSQLRNTLIITGSLNDLASTAGFSLPALPLFDGGDVTFYTRVNPEGSGAIAREFLLSSTEFEYYSRAEAMRTTYTAQTETGETDENGDPVYTEETLPVVQWTTKNLYSLQGVTVTDNELYYNGSPLYLCSLDEDGNPIAYTRLTKKNDAVYALTEDATEDGCVCTLAFETGKQSLVVQNINTAEGAYIDIEKAAGENYTDLNETISLPAVAAPYRYSALYAKVNQVPEGMTAVVVNGEQYVCVNMFDESGNYIVDTDNGGFRLYDAYKDGRELYYLDYDYTLLTADEATALAAKDVAVYAKTDGIGSLPLQYAMDALNSVLDKDTLTMDDMARYFDIALGDSEILETILYVPFAYLSDAINPSVSNVALDEVLNLNADSPKVLLYLAYGEEGVGYEIRETVDEATGEVVSRELIVYERKTVGSVTSATETLRISDIVSVTDSSSNLLQAVQDWTLNDFSNSAKVDSLTLGQVLTIVTDEEAAASDGTLTASPNILQALAEVSLGDMSTAIESLTLESILGSDAVEGDALLQLLRNSTIATLANDIKSMTIQELFADSVYEYHEVDSFTASTGDTPHRTDFSALQTLYEQYRELYGAEYLYVKQGNVYQLVSDFLAEYQANNADVGADEDYSGSVPNVLYSPYLQVNDNLSDYANAPLYYLQSVETSDEESETTSVTYKMTLASTVTGWILPDTLPDGVTADTLLYVRARNEDGSYKKDEDGNYIYELAKKDDDGYYTASTLYYWYGAAGTEKSISLTPARYELADEYNDGRALFSRLVYTDSVAEDAELYDQNGLYYFDVTTQTFRRLELANVYLDAANPAAGTYYYYGSDGNLYRVNGETDPETGAPVPVTGVAVTPAYFDADGNVYYYGEDGALCLVGGGIVSEEISLTVRYAVDRSADTIPAVGTALYSYGNVSGLWKYLLRDENGAIQAYTLQNVSAIVQNMSANIKVTPLRDLYEDDLISITPNSGTTVEDILSQEVPEGLSYAGKTLGDLTVGQLVNLMYELLTKG